LKVQQKNTKAGDYPSLWWDEERKIIKVIDQRRLPFLFEIFEARTLNEVAFAIKEMVVRGAPLIGITAAFGMVLAAQQSANTSREVFVKKLKEAKNILLKTRPTAVDLFNNLEIMQKMIDVNRTNSENIQQLKLQAKKLLEATLSECKKIGEVGAELFTLKTKSVLTYCNAGALATVDYGTALAPIREAHKRGKRFTVFVPETRPRLQGGRLTAWELANEGIDHLIITDNAIGHYLKKGVIDLVIVGADRITVNGDVANKIGTYTISVLCKEHHVPFFVAAPLSTFDLQTKKGEEIIIEERSEEEVRTVLCVESSKDQKPKRRLIHNPNSPNKNPAFDVTPAENITGIITAKGILRQPLKKKIAKLFNPQ